MPSRLLLALCSVAGTQAQKSGDTMHHVTLHDLQFATVPYRWCSSSGLPYPRWARVGMPKIPQSAIDTTFFLFKGRQAAELGEDPGGTGFIVAAPSEKDPNAMPHSYAVSCHHTVCTQGYSCIRLNRKSGGNEIMNLARTNGILSRTSAISPLVA